MQKKIALLFFLFVVIVLYLFINRYNNINNYIFKYPDFPIDFAWEVVPVDKWHFFIRERFDKEFIVSSNTLYQFYLYVKRYPLYIPYIEKKLKENNIPDDFKYLAIAESALKNDVISSAWATWIWQFMPETAKQYWLIVNDEVDERYNFEKSTDSAILYFKALYKIFWDRTLVAASYNRWESAIKKALTAQTVESYYDLYLNEETSRYVFRILAIKYILKNYFDDKNIIDFMIWEPFTNPEAKVIKVDEIDNLFEFAKSYNQNYNTIKLLNPWIKWSKLSKWDWEVKVLK